MRVAVLKVYLRGLVVAIDALLFVIRRAVGLDVDEPSTRSRCSDD